MANGKGRRSSARKAEEPPAAAVDAAPQGEGVARAAGLAIVTPAEAAPKPARRRRARREPAPLVVVDARGGEEEAAKKFVEVRVRRFHRRDINRTWEFLKLVFRDVNRETVEYQRPRSKSRFQEVYEEEGEQLLFEVGDRIVGYAECCFDATGADNWINPRYFEKRGMRPLFVDELAVHPDFQGRGVGAFMLDQLQHLARVRGCTHIVLEVAENNTGALSWYRRRNFYKLDAAIFLAQKIPAEPELLPPRKLPIRGRPGAKTRGARKAPRTPVAGRSARRKQG